METPSLTTRVTTRSQSALKNINNNIPISRYLNESENDVDVSKSVKKFGKQHREDRFSGLIDLSNDSPIVGLAAGNMKTPPSNVAKQGTRNRENTGEELLRGQVNKLLQKVEKEADISEISSFRGLRYPHCYGGLANSPFALLAITPANTPQRSNLYADKISFGSSVNISSSTVTRDDFKISQIAEQEDSADSEKSYTITRSLLLDFSDINLKECNHSVSRNDEEDYAGAGDQEESSVNALCSVMTKMSIATTWTGKHTRFEYNSDDEIETVEEKVHDVDVEAASVMRLNGLPTPKGKHIRFTEAN